MVQTIDILDIKSHHNAKYLEYPQFLSGKDQEDNQYQCASVQNSIRTMIAILYPVLG